MEPSPRNVPVPRGKHKKFEPTHRHDPNACIAAAEMAKLLLYDANRTSNFEKKS
jgi:hypothetical protein